MSPQISIAGAEPIRVESDLTAGQALDEKYGRKPLAVKVNGRAVDLATPLSSLEDGAGTLNLEPILENSPEGLDILRHSASHIMAEAVKELFPEGQGGHRPGCGRRFFITISRWRTPSPPKTCPGSKPR